VWASIESGVVLAGLLVDLLGIGRKLVVEAVEIRVLVASPEYLSAAAIC
jgi:hypothetical protein